MTITVTLCPLSVSESKQTTKVIDLFNKAIKRFQNEIPKANLPGDVSQFIHWLTSFEASFGVKSGFKEFHLPMLNVTLSEEANNLFEAFMAFSGTIKKLKINQNDEEEQKISDPLDLFLFMMRHFVLLALQEEENFSKKETRQARDNRTVENESRESSGKDSPVIAERLGNSEQTVYEESPLYVKEPARKAVAVTLGKFVDSVLKDQSIFPSSDINGDQLRGETFPRLMRAISCMATQIANKKKNTELFRSLTDELYAIEKVLRFQINILALPNVGPDDVSDELTETFFFEKLERQFPLREGTDLENDQPLDPFYLRCKRLELGIQQSRLSDDPTVYNSKPVLLERIKAYRSVHSMRRLSGKMGDIFSDTSWLYIMTKVITFASFTDKLYELNDHLNGLPPLIKWSSKFHAVLSIVERFTTTRHKLCSTREIWDIPTVGDATIRDVNNLGSDRVISNISDKLANDLQELDGLQNAAGAKVFNKEKAEKVQKAIQSALDDYEVSIGKRASPATTQASPAATQASPAATQASPAATQASSAAAQAQIQVENTSATSTLVENVMDHVSGMISRIIPIFQQQSEQAAVVRRNAHRDSEQAESFRGLTQAPIEIPEPNVFEAVHHGFDTVLVKANNLLMEVLLGSERYIYANTESPRNAYSEAQEVFQQKLVYFLAVAAVIDDEDDRRAGSPSNLNETMVRTSDPSQQSETQRLDKSFLAQLADFYAGLTKTELQILIGHFIRNDKKSDAEIKALTDKLIAAVIPAVNARNAQRTGESRQNQRRVSQVHPDYNHEKYRNFRGKTHGYFLKALEDHPQLKIYWQYKLTEPLAKEMEKDAWRIHDTGRNGYFRPFARALDNSGISISKLEDFHLNDALGALAEASKPLQKCKMDLEQARQRWDEKYLKIFSENINDLTSYGFQREIVDALRADPKKISKAMRWLVWQDETKPERISSPIVNLLQMLLAEDSDIEFRDMVPWTMLKTLLKSLDFSVNQSILNKDELEAPDMVVALYLLTYAYQELKNIEDQSSETALRKKAILNETINLVLAKIKSFGKEMAEEKEPAPKPWTAYSGVKLTAETLVSSNDDRYNKQAFEKFQEDMKKLEAGLSRFASLSVSHGNLIFPNGILSLPTGLSNFQERRRLFKSIGAAAPISKEEETVTIICFLARIGCYYPELANNCLEIIISRSDQILATLESGRELTQDKSVTRLLSSVVYARDSRLMTLWGDAEAAQQTISEQQALLEQERGQKEKAEANAKAAEANAKAAEANAKAEKAKRNVIQALFLVQPHKAQAILEANPSLAREIVNECETEEERVAQTKLFEINGLERFLVLDGAAAAYAPGYRGGSSSSGGSASPSDSVSNTASSVPRAAA